MKKLLISAIAVGGIIMLILYPDIVVSATSSSLETCFNILLPSLFPFFVLSKIFVLSGGADVLGKMMNLVMRPLFKVSGNGAAVFILGIISGYPIGAKTAVDMNKSSLITKSEAENLVCFCNNAGPLFIIGALGSGMLASPKLGIMLYTIHIMSSITLGIILRSSIKTNTSHVYSSAPGISRGTIFTNAVESSVVSILNVFAYVIFFAVAMDVLKAGNIFLFTNIIDSLIHMEIATPIVYSIFEMTSGIKMLSASENALSTKLILSSFMLGWSGFSIHFQTKSILDKAGLSFKKYIVSKFFNGVIASIYTFITLKFINIDITVFSNKFYYWPQFNYAPYYLTSATLIICILYFIVRLRSKYNIQYSKPERRATR